MLRQVADTVSKHTTELASAQIAAAATASPTRYIQNTTSAAIHAVRANNNAQTVCGWSFGLTCRRSRLRRTTNHHVVVASLVGVSWQLICKNCLPQERATVAAQDHHLEPLSGDEGDVSEQAQCISEPSASTMVTWDKCTGGFHKCSVVADFPACKNAHHIYYPRHIKRNGTA